MQAVLIAEQYLWVNYVKCRKRVKKKSLLQLIFPEQDGGIHSVYTLWTITLHICDLCTFLHICFTSEKVYLTQKERWPHNPVQALYWQHWTVRSQWLKWQISHHAQLTTIPYREVKGKNADFGDLVIWFGWETDEWETYRMHPVKKQYKDLPGGALAKMPCSQCRGPGFNSWTMN